MAKKIDVNGLDHYHDKVSAMLASEYSSSKTYAVGDYCFHAGTLYECTTAITTAEAWTSGHWTAAKLADNTSALKTAFSYTNLEETNNASDWSQGYWTIADGTINTNSGTWIKTPGFISDDIVKAYDNSSLLLYLQAWDKTSGNYVGTWNGSQWSTTYTSGSGLLELDIVAFRKNYPNYKFKITVTASNSESINPSTNGTQIYLVRSKCIHLEQDVSDLQTAIVRIDDNLFTASEMTPIATSTGWRLNESNGLCTSDSSYKLVKYIVKAGTVVRVISDDRFQFQNSADVPYSGTNNRIGDTTYQTGDYVLTVPQGATYLIVSTKASDSAANAYLLDNNTEKLKDLTNYTEAIDIDGFIHVTHTEMESGSFTSAGYAPDDNRCRAKNHYIKARKGDIVVGHRKTADILMAVTDDPYSTTTLYTSGWRTTDFALAIPYDGYYVLLGKTALDDFDGDFTIYPAKQFFKALPERYYLTEIATTLASITDKQTEPCLCFPLITDIHYGAYETSTNPYLFHKTYRNLLKVIQEKRSDAVVCLGDITEGDFSSKQTAIDFGTRVNDMFMMLGVPYLLTIGNHDDNRYSYPVSNRFNNSDICKVNTAYVDNAVVYNTATNGRDYYVDFPNYKIRLISIDAVDNLGYAYNTDTVTWFTNTALDTPADYLAVILTHVSPISSQNYNNTAVTNGSDIAQAIEDYIEGGKDAFQLYGHSHADVAFTSPYLSIATCCNKFTNENGDEEKWPEGATMPERTEGTATEDLWDFVIIKPYSKTVSLIRFGAGDDREFTYGTV